METNYYSKYLKYKSKYLELKKQLGGNGDNCINLERIRCGITPRCKWDISKKLVCSNEKQCKKINEEIVNKLKELIKNNMRTEYNLRELVSLQEQSKIIDVNKLSEIIEYSFRINILNDNIKNKIINNATNKFNGITIEIFEEYLKNYESLRSNDYDPDKDIILNDIRNNYIENYNTELVLLKQHLLKKKYGTNFNQHKKKHSIETIIILHHIIVDVIDDIIKDDIINDITTQNPQYVCKKKECYDYRNIITCMGMGATGCKNHYNSKNEWLDCAEK